MCFVIIFYIYSICPPVSIFVLLPLPKQISSKESGNANGHSPIVAATTHTHQPTTAKACPTATASGASPSQQQPSPQLPATITQNTAYQQQRETQQQSQPQQLPQQQQQQPQQHLPKDQHLQMMQSGAVITTAEVCKPVSTTAATVTAANNNNLDNQQQQNHNQTNNNNNNPSRSSSQQSLTASSVSSQSPHHGHNAATITTTITSIMSSSNNPNANAPSIIQQPHHHLTTTSSSSSSTSITQQQFTVHGTHHHHFLGSNDHNGPAPNVTVNPHYQPNHGDPNPRPIPMSSTLNSSSAAVDQQIRVLTPSEIMRTLPSLCQEGYEPAPALPILVQSKNNNSFVLVQLLLYHFSYFLFTLFLYQLLFDMIFFLIFKYTGRIILLFVFVYCDILFFNKTDHLNERPVTPFSFQIELYFSTNSNNCFKFYKDI